MSSRIFSLRLSAFNAFLFLGTGIQTPFLPLWLKDRGLDPDQIAFILAAMTAVRVLAIPLGAYIADKYGNRRTIIVGTAFAAFASYLLLAFVPGFHPILIVAVMAAALFAPIGPLVEILSIEGSNHHGLDYGRIRLWASLSFLAGSLLSGALLEYLPVSSVVYLIAAAQGLGACFALVLPPDPGHVVKGREPFHFGQLALFLGGGSFLVFAAAAGIGQATHGFFYAFGSIHWEQLGYSKLTIGELWAAAVLTEVVMFAFSNRFHAHFGSLRLIMVGVACGLVRWCLIGLNPPLAILYFAQMLHAGSFGLTHLGTMHYIRETVPAGMRNTVQGVYTAVSQGILMSAFMWGAGPLYGAFGGQAYFIMAGFSAVALGFAVTLVKLSPREPVAVGS
jgi:PPP family 3-phenylpropionic acid transporter